MYIMWVYNTPQKVTEKGQQLDFLSDLHEAFQSLEIKWNIYIYLTLKIVLFAILIIVMCKSWDF